MLPPYGIAFRTGGGGLRRPTPSCPSGLSAHLLAIFARTGIDAGTVVLIGALFGPAQVGARLIEFAFGRNLHPLWVARFALSRAARARLRCWRCSAFRVPVAAAFALMFGGANGLVTITRGAVPLALFGAAGYGRLMGRLAGPFLLMQSAAPLVMAFVVGTRLRSGGARAGRRLRRGRAGLLCPDQEAGLAEQHVDIALAGVAGIAVEPRAVEQSGADERLAGGRIDGAAIVALEHALHLVLDAVQASRSRGRCADR